jgi:hypothetical protein
MQQHSSIEEKTKSLSLTNCSDLSTRGSIIGQALPHPVVLTKSAFRAYKGTQLRADYISLLGLRKMSRRM